MKVTTSFLFTVTLKDPIERGLKDRMIIPIWELAFYVTLKDPIERGLKGHWLRQSTRNDSCCYTQRPDRKGTESLNIFPCLAGWAERVTLKDPIERGLKGFKWNSGVLEGSFVTLKDPIERGLKVYQNFFKHFLYFFVTLKDPIERGLKGVGVILFHRLRPFIVTLKDPIERGLKDQLKRCK